MAVDLNKLIPTAISGLQSTVGLAGLLGDAAKPADMTYYQRQIDAADPGYGQNYYSNDQVLQAYQNHLHIRNWI